MNVDSGIGVLIGGVKEVMEELEASLDAGAAEAYSYSGGSFCVHKKVGF